MLVYRLARAAFIHHLSGEGSRRFGGRWNRKGTSVLYTSENRALATLEYLVHLPLTLMPADLCMAEIEIPDIYPIRMISPEMLPSDWMNHPPPFSLVQLGEEWLTEGTSLSLKVPSAVVKNEWNILLNPQHHLFANITIRQIDQFHFDSRLPRLPS